MHRRPDVSDLRRSAPSSRISITYAFDAHCPWCHAVTPVVRELVATEPGLRVDVVHGRLLPEPGQLGAVGWYRPTATTVGELTRAPFGERFGAALGDPGLASDSDTTAAAFVAMRSIAPDLALDVAAAMHTALFVDGRSPSDLDTVLDLATSLGISADRVRSMLGNPLVGRLARFEQLRIGRLGFATYPALVVTVDGVNVPVTTRLRPLDRIRADVGAVLDGAREHQV